MEAPLTTHDGFWSYAHADNDRSYGRVLELAKAIGDEFALVTGEELELFIDRKDLRWGDVWRSRIEEAIGDVPFFIALVTPMYLKSDECRKELIAFSGLAKSRGLDRLFLPILYIDVPGLSEDSDDEVLALIARTQFIDWRPLRNKKISSEEHLDAVHKLADELVARRAEMAAVSRSVELKSDSELEAELQSTIDQINAKLPDWMESVEFDQVAGAQWAAARDARLARVRRLIDSNQSQGAVLSTLLKLGSELIPIAEDRVAKAQSYAKLTIELDPLVSRAIRLLILNRPSMHLLNPLRDGINEAYLNIEDPENEQNYGLPQRFVQFNKNLELAHELMVQSATHVQDGNELVLRWREALKELDGDPVLQLL